MHRIDQVNSVHQVNHASCTFGFSTLEQIEPRSETMAESIAFFRLSAALVAKSWQCRSYGRVRSKHPRAWTG